MILSNTQFQQSLDSITTRIPRKPRVALVLGSGLGEFADTLTAPVVIPSADVPHYPRSTVPGHKGWLVFGEIGRSYVVAFQGRVHLYETGDAETVTYPIRLAHSLGASILVVTNAAGGINRSFQAGDLMIIADHLSFTEPGAPTRQSAGRGLRIPYSSDLINLAAEVAGRAGIPVQMGVYAGVRGPSYETAAEVEMLHRAGADAVGMSTVPEVEIAAELGMQVLGISCITNKATGIGGQKLSHDEVTVVANKVKANFSTLLTEIIKSL